jgi:hypothetical protein
MFSNNVRIRVALGALAVFVMSLGTLAILGFAARSADSDSTLDASAGTDVPGLGSAQSIPSIEPSPGSEADGVPLSATGVAVGEPHRNAPTSSSPLAPADLEPVPVTECGPNQRVAVSKYGNVVCLEPGDSMPPDPTSSVAGPLPIAPTPEPAPEAR